MQFNSHADNQDLISDITFLLSGVDVTNYPLVDRTRNINERFKMIWEMIFESYGGWKFQDDNLDENPYADQTVTSGTADYSLPSGSLTVNLVEIKNSGGTWEILTPISLEEYKRMGADATNTSNGVPSHYLLYEDKIKLIPTPNFTQASSLRVYFDKGIEEFEYDDTTKVPGFASPFHRMLSVGAALDYAIARGLTQKITELQKLFNDYEYRLRSYYKQRYKDRLPNRIKTNDSLLEFT